MTERVIVVKRMWLGHIVVPANTGGSMRKAKIQS